MASCVEQTHSKPIAFLRAERFLEVSRLVSKRRAVKMVWRLTKSIEI